VPGVPLGVHTVCPVIVKDSPDMVTAEAQVQLPDGTTTVSPLDAALIAACTSLDEQEAELIV